MNRLDWICSKGYTVELSQTSTALHATLHHKKTDVLMEFKGYRLFDSWETLNPIRSAWFALKEMERTAA